MPSSSEPLPWIAPWSRLSLSPLPVSFLQHVPSYIPSLSPALSVSTLSSAPCPHLTQTPHTHSTSESVPISLFLNFPSLAPRAQLSIPGCSFLFSLPAHEIPGGLWPLPVPLSLPCAQLLGTQLLLPAPLPAFTSIAASASHLCLQLFLWGRVCPTGYTFPLGLPYLLVSF